MINKIYYRITLEDSRGSLSFSNAKEDEAYYSLDCKIDKSASNSVHNVNIAIYNLPQSIRNRFAKNVIEVNKKITIIVEAGIKTNSMTLMFKGMINEFMTSKEGGHTNISNITAYAGAIDSLTSISSFALGGSSTIYDLKQSYANSMNLDLVSDSTRDTLLLDSNYSSSTNDILNEVRNRFQEDDIFIDNQKLHFYDKNYYRKKSLSVLPVLSEESGLLDVPRYYSNVIECRTILMTFLNKASVVSLKSIANNNSRINGIYTVAGVIHTFSTSYSAGKINGESKLELLNI